MDLNTLYTNARGSDKTSENQLFEALGARFHYFVRHRIRNKDDCGEVVQNALAAVAKDFRAITFEVSFAAWAHKILERKIMDYYRSRKRQQNVFSPMSDFDDPESGPQLNQEVRRKLIDCLQKVNTVNQRHARVLVLKYQGFDCDEICRRLGLTRNNAYSVLYRARTMLKHCLEKGDIE